MKYLLYLITLTVVFSACGGEVEAVWPEDLAGKKALLTSKKDELRTIESDIKKLESEIDNLQPNKEKARELVTLAKVEKSDFLKELCHWLQ